MNNYKNGKTPCARFLAGMLLLATCQMALAFERTENREPCVDHSETRKPMFGDLHVHTSFSFDSYVSSQRNEPSAAYRYAKGMPIILSEIGRAHV